MEQYEIPTNRYFENIQKALKHFQAKHILIRFVGSAGGKKVFDKNLKDKKLSIGREKNGIWIEINGKQSFFFAIKKMKGIKRGYIWGSHWLIAYDRLYENGRPHISRIGYPNQQEPYTGPDDPNLPKVKQTILRASNEDYLIEIIFPGKIPIKKIASCPDSKDLYNWEVDLKQ